MSRALSKPSVLVQMLAFLGVSPWPQPDAQRPVAQPAPATPAPIPAIAQKIESAPSVAVPVVETLDLQTVLRSQRLMRLNKWSLQLLHGAVGTQHGVATTDEDEKVRLFTWTTPNGYIYHEDVCGACGLVLYRDLGPGTKLEFVKESEPQ